MKLSSFVPKFASPVPKCASPVLKVLSATMMLSASIVHAGADGWTAKVISVKGKVPAHYSEDYATTRYKNPWDFNEGGLEGMSSLKGAVGPAVSRGRLRFYTKGKTILTWGDFSGKNPGTESESIGEQWVDSRLPWVVRIRLKQSLEKSRWKLELASPVHGRIRIMKKNATLTGNREKTLVFTMGGCRNVYRGVRLSTDTGNNRVEIDWITIERLSTKRYFRKTVFLEDKPLTAVAALSCGTGFTLYINGHEVGTRNSRPPFDRKLNLFEGIGLFKKGRNLIAVAADRFDWTGDRNNAGFFLFEATVATRAGKIEKIYSDHTWKGSYHAKEGWQHPSCDDTAWEPVSVSGGFEVIRNHAGFIEPPPPAGFHISPRDREFPFFKEKEKLVFDVKIPDFKDLAKASVEYSVRELHGKTKQENGTRLFGGAGASKNSLQLGIENPGKGAYLIDLTLKIEKRIVARRVYEFVVAGEIQQPAMDSTNRIPHDGLSVVDVIDPVARFHSGRVVSGITDFQGKLMPSRDLPRVSHLAGKPILETGNRNGDWYSVEFRVKNTGSPHIAEITYPDDADRHMVFLASHKTRFPDLVNIGPGGGIQRGASGVHTGGNLKNSGSFRSFRFLFWPLVKNGYISIVNCGEHRERGAASRITIHEIDGSLPASALSGKTEDRYVGQFTERIDRSIPHIFYTGPLGESFPYLLVGGYFAGYYAAWYNAVENLIKYLRFSGLNSYYAGIYMYRGGFFPSADFQGKAEGGEDIYGAGWPGGVVPLMATMFDAAGMNLFLGVQFIGTRKLSALERGDPNGNANGLRFVTATGKIKMGFANEGYNFLHKQVENEMLNLADEISARYSKYPAIKGITWMRNPEFKRAGNDPDTPSCLDVGYGDLTVSLYEKEMGIKVPAGPPDRGRFWRRRSFLMKNRKEEWVEWRCRKVHDLLTKIASRLTRANRDWKFRYIINIPSTRHMTLWDKGKLSVEELYRYRGHDPSLYAPGADVGLVYIHELNAWRRWRDRYNDRRYEDVTRFFHSDELNEYFSDRGVFLRVHFIFENKLIPNEKSGWKRIFFTGYSAPPLEDFIREAAYPLEKGKREMVILGWSDDGHLLGHEESIRGVSSMVLQGFSSQDAAKEGVNR